MGKGIRAYAMGNIKGPTSSHYGHRTLQHANHLDDLIDRGYLPHEWINFDSKHLNKEDALFREKQLIQSLKPKYNKPYGIKHLKFDLEGIKKIKKLRKEGLFYSQIAEVMGCSQMVAHRIVNDLSPRYKEMINGE